MLFNSYTFILFFFPSVFAGYFLLHKFTFSHFALTFLFLASLFFYGFWNFHYTPLILISIFVNYFIGRLQNISINLKIRRVLLLSGISFNVLFLMYFKYCNFFINNLNFVFNTKIPSLEILLPLGISFFTFTQIAFLIDAYQRKIRQFNFLNYALFVTFFPHLLAGPIVHHAELMPQFSEKKNRSINYQNMVLGLLVFSLGLFKKAYIADQLSDWVSNGYAFIEHLSQLEAWLLSFCYTFQIYFDFSGYTDMAIGCALMLNIDLPANFNSPYKAMNIQDFWRRWHITLSRWLKNYIYIPLGGSQKKEWLTYRNLMLTFLIGGFWHGAAWTFVMWGFLHGLAISIFHLWKKTQIQLPKLSAWAITFLFVNFSWIFFRADSFSQANSLLKKMIFPESFSLSISHFTSSRIGFFALLFTFAFISFFAKNSLELKATYRGTLVWNIATASLFTLGILSLMKITTFIYFQF